MLFFSEKHLQGPTIQHVIILLCIKMEKRPLNIHDLYLTISKKKKQKAKTIHKTKRP